MKDRDLDARPQWIGKANNQRCMLSATKQVISIKLTTAVGHFYVTLTLQTCTGLDRFKLLTSCVSYFVGTYDKQDLSETITRHVGTYDKQDLLALITHMLALMINRTCRK